MLHICEILKAIDERQQLAEGRPLWMSAHQLFTEITGAYPTNEQAPGFLQELNVANAAGLLTWHVSDPNARLEDAYIYLQRMDQLALTVAGQDRARNQMVV